MKKIIYLLLINISLISCSEVKQVKRIEWTSTSEDAKVLFEEFSTKIAEVFGLDTTKKLIQVK